jgi:exonuclease SbcC
MKDYPRIYSLSTINIIHHQNFDYLFHPFRTDFSGDSGVGKSILTDLIQLILVGSTVYESATESNGDRPFNNLVLESKDKGDFGYAFINVEVEENSFLVVGVFIERNKNRSQAFIIKKGIGFQNYPFASLDQPMTIRDFEFKDKWLPIDELKTKLNTSDYFGFEKWQNFVEFHLHLKENNILPLDLSKGNNTLKYYAQILQAFSRKGIDVKNKMSLQDFLFGSDKRTVFVEEYDKAVKDLQEDNDLFQSNRSEISDIEKKKDKLQNLYELKTKKENLEEEYAVQSYLFINRELEGKQKELKKKLENYFQSKNEIGYLNQQIIDKVKHIDDNKEQWAIDLETVEADFKIHEKKRDEILKVDNFINETGLKTTKELLAFHKNFHLKNDYRNKLEFLNDSLKKHNLEKEFEALDHKKNDSIIIKDLQLSITEIKNEIEEGEALKDFNDVQNKSSLAYWVVNSTRKFNELEESVIRHFNTLKTSVPLELDTKAKYLSSPDRLLLSVKDLDSKIIKDGFWIDLSGLSYYIPKYQNPILNTLSKKEVVEYFKNSTNEIEKKLQELKRKQTNLKALLEIFESLEERNLYLNAWLQRDALSLDINVKDNEILKNWNYDKLAFSLQQNYSEKEHCLEEYKKYEVQVKAARQKEILNDSLYTNLKKYKTIQPGVYTEVESLFEMNLPKNLKVNSELTIKNIVESFYRDIDSVYQGAKEHLDSFENIKEINTTINEREIELTKLKSDYEHHLKKIEVKNINSVDFKQTEKLYFEAFGEFKARFDSIVDDYIFNESETIKSNKDFIKLSETILPKIFDGISFKDLDVMTLITERLKKINEQNRDLGENKLRRIREILQDVQDEVSKQINIVREINLFFDKENAKITGNHKAVLEKDTSTRISTKWITKFISDFTKPAGMFRTTGDFSDQMDALPSMKEKIEYSYQSFNDSAKPNVDYKTLLNPFSYYNLNYYITTQDGTLNSGSTGQTYSALALLCIAKLSLLDNGKVGKDNKGLRFMNIDETESIGSNFDMLSDIAKEYDYQIISMSINPLKLDEGKQYIYQLNRNLKYDQINHHPAGIFTKEDESKYSLEN